MAPGRSGRWRLRRVADAGASGAAGADGARAQLIPEKLGGVGAAGFGRGGGPLPREGQTQRRRFNCTEMAVIYKAPVCGDKRPCHCEVKEVQFPAQIRTGLKPAWGVITAEGHTPEAHLLPPQPGLGFLLIELQN